MKLTVINSNSSGNSYILENDREALLIECGVRFNRIKEAIGFNVGKIKGCLISHEHQDHCCAAKDVVKAGVDIYTSKGTREAIGIISHRLHDIKAHETFTVGGFNIYPFDVKHDAAEPLCFLIHHEECGNVLFLTDSYYVEYTFDNLNNILVEANYCQSIVDQMVRDGKSPKFLRNRVLSSHMSIKTCKEFLQANDLSQVNNIVLIHLSDSNSDSSRFQREVQELTGKTVSIATAGLVIPNFNKTPF